MLNLADFFYLFILVVGHLDVQLENGRASVGKVVAWRSPSQPIQPHRGPHLELTMLNMQLHICNESAHALSLLMAMAGQLLPALVSERSLSKLPIQYPCQSLEVPLLCWSQVKEHLLHLSFQHQGQVEGCFFIVPATGPCC